MSSQFRKNTHVRTHTFCLANRRHTHIQCTHSSTAGGSHGQSPCNERPPESTRGAKQMEVRWTGRKELEKVECLNKEEQTRRKIWFGRDRKRKRFSNYISEDRGGGRRWRLRRRRRRRNQTWSKLVKAPIILLCHRSGKGKQSEIKESGRLKKMQPSRNFISNLWLPWSAAEFTTVTGDHESCSNCLQASFCNVIAYLKEELTF